MIKTIKHKPAPHHKARIIFDIVLLLLFGAMANTDITGVAFHEIAGLIYTFLIAVHLGINHKWLTAAIKGRLKGRRALILSLVNIGLFVDLAIILWTGLRASHILLPAVVKAPDYFLAIHSICGVAAAPLVLIHILLHAKAITKNSLKRKVAFMTVLSLVIGYSLLGTVQGSLKWTIGKEGEERKGEYEQHDIENGEDMQKPKDGERKEADNG